MGKSEEPGIESIGVLLVDLGKRAMATAGEVLAPLGLSGMHWRILTVSASGTLSQQQLSRVTGVDRTTMVGVIDDLERLGYAVRERDPDDRRRYIVGVTQQGRVALRKARRLIDRAEDRMLGQLSKAERATFESLVRRILQTESSSRET